MFIGRGNNAAYRDEPNQSGRCSPSTSQAVTMPPTMANWPVPKLSTFEVEYITL